MLRAIAVATKIQNRQLQENLRRIRVWCSQKGVLGKKKSAEGMSKRKQIGSAGRTPCLEHTHVAVTLKVTSLPGATLVWSAGWTVT